MSRIGPGATGAVKALRLVHRQQRPGAFELDALLAQRVCGGVQRPPTASGRGIGCEHRLVSQFMIRGVGRGEGRLIAHKVPFHRRFADSYGPMPPRRFGGLFFHSAGTSSSWVDTDTDAIVSNTPSRRISPWNSAAASCTRTRAKNAKAREKCASQSQ